MAMDVVELVRDLVRIPSVNPMGRAVEGEIYLETRLTDHLEGVLSHIGLTVERHTMAPGRDNLIAGFQTGDADDRPTLLLEAHQDTVPVDGMTIDPFGAELENGRVFGRGSCDIKGGLSSVVAALSTLAASQARLPWRIVAAFSVNEEYGYSGAALLRSVWNSARSRILTQPPDAIVVTEPTELNVVVAHKGISRWRCRTRGKAVHSSEPRNGVNAIYRMSRVIPRIEQYAEVLSSGHEHPLVGRPTVNIGLIQGGLSVNTVPDQCCIEVERRMLPDESPEKAYADMVAYIDEGLDDNDRPEHELPYMASIGLSDDRNQQFAKLVQSVVTQMALPCQCMGVPYGTDASELATDGVPTVVFGPGSILQAHTADEWIAVEQLEKATRILVQLAHTKLDETKTRPE